MADKDQRYKDPSLNRFTKTNMYYVNDPYILYQDPTYLGFKLFFLFDQPDSGLLSTKDYPNTAYGYLMRIGETVRAGYLKKFVEHLKNINSVTPWFFQTITGLGDAWKHGYQEDGFKALLPKDRKISIGCLDESVDLRITALMDLYRKACFDWPNRREIVPLNLRYFKVAIYCYEARNINRTGSSFPFSVAQKKNGAKYPPTSNQDQQYNTKLLLGKDPLENATSADYKIDTINDNISRILFNFSYCEFLPDESGAMFNEMSNKEMKLSAQTVAFSYRNVFEDNVYTIWSPDKKVTDLVNLFVDSAALDSPGIVPKSGDAPGGYGIGDINNPEFNLLSKVDKYLGVSRTIENFTDLVKPPIGGFNVGNVYGIDTSTNIPPIGQAALNLVQNQALGQVNRLFLGNIYGFSSLGAAGLANGANPASLIGGAVNEIAGGNNASINNNSEVAQGNMGFNESSSNSNKENSSKSTSQSVGNQEASKSNSINSGKSTPQSVGNPFASKANDNGFDSSTQTTGNSQASLSNG